MAFRFQRKESVTKSIRRLGAERIASALHHLNEPIGPIRIHEARKDIKKIRAILRLVHGSFSKKRFRRLIKMLRKSAFPLAALRDAWVNTTTLKALASQFKNRLSSQTLFHTRRCVKRSAESAMKVFVKNDGAQVKAILCQIAKEFKQINIRDGGWEAIGPGICSAYEKGRRAFRAVLKNPSSKNFHRWRRRAKDLWYQVRLLRPISPKKMNRIAQELKVLTEFLGDDHDLYELVLFLQANSKTGPLEDALKILCFVETFF